MINTDYKLGDWVSVVCLTNNEIRSCGCCGEDGSPASLRIIGKLKKSNDVYVLEIPIGHRVKTFGKFSTDYNISESYIYLPDLKGKNYTNVAYKYIIKKIKKPQSCNDCNGRRLQL